MVSHFNYRFLLRKALVSAISYQKVLIIYKGKKLCPYLNKLNGKFVHCNSV